MADLNKVLLIGNLTKDPELRYTSQGTAVVTLRLAVNTPYKDKSGQTQKSTCFINVVVWAKMAEVCNQYLQKGRQIFVEGRLQTRSWQGGDGKNRSVIEVNATRVQFFPQSSPREEAKDVDLGEAPEDGLNLDNAVQQETGELN